MKNIRVIGIDDSPFSRGDERALVVGVVCRRARSGKAHAGCMPLVEGVLSTKVDVDGRDATAAICQMIRRSRFLPQIKCIMLNSIMMAGFNVVDIHALSEELAIPVIAVTRKKPSKEAAERAMRKHFADWKERMAIVEAAQPIHKYKHYMQIAGISEREAREIVDEFGIEPVRLANIMAGGVCRGESKGRM